jgi:hypothetical protein
MDHMDTVLQRCSPSAPLSAFITSYWLYQSGPPPHARERALPTGIAQLVIDLSGDGLIAADSSPDSLAGGVSTADTGVDAHRAAHATARSGAG